QQQHLRAFATAFGQRSPFFESLREWEHLRRKTAEQWALEMPRRLHGSTTDSLQALQLASAEQWNPYSPHYSAFLMSTPTLQTPGYIGSGLSCPLDSTVGGNSPDSFATGLSERIGATSSLGAPCEQQSALILKTDSLLTPRINGTMSSSSDSCLTDRISELRQGLGMLSGSGLSIHQTPTTNTPFLSGNTGAPYFSASLGGYGIFSTAGNFVNGGNTNMYLSTPFVPPSLFYPQFCSSISQNPLHPSLHLLGNELRSVLDASLVSQQQRSHITGGLTNTISSPGANPVGSNRNETNNEESRNHMTLHSSSSATSSSLLSLSTNGPTEGALWRPY
ncbi:uncharacterized protein LOC111083398, partial [Limulus polyphemus]|uniref:Uncharacterized protein LOC111083398 n=1 Tax=Limulus polyphemus TaxID=6850 RepID=A0ABM1RW58_LIMPO